MKRIILALAIGAAAVARAASPAATQEWVRDYIATNGVYRTDITQTITASNGVATCSYTDPTAGLVTMTMNMRDQLAILATNCTSAAVALGVTNGTLFAWNGSTQFVNAVIGQRLYSPTTNCLVFAGVSSVTNSTMDEFPGYFSFVGGRIDRPTARTLLGE